MYRPYGVLPALATPMTEDEKINEKELRNQVNRMIAAGVHGIFCLGTNGEFYALTMEEKKEVIRIVLDENRGRLPICAGTGCITTRETIELTQKAKDLGVDAVSIITPYFVAVSQEELYDHYRIIARSVDVPIILYNIPSRTGVSLSCDTVYKLSQISNIIGIKDSSGNFDNILGYIEQTDEDFAVISGTDSLILWTLMAGGKAGVSGLANIIPERIAAIYELWKKGDQKGAEKAQSSIRPLRDCLSFGNPNSVVKRAMNLMGYPVGPARGPVPGTDGRNDEEILRVVKLYQ